MSKHFIRKISDLTRIEVDDHYPVTGGDINRAYCLKSGGKQYFLKVHPSTSNPDIFEKESDGLLALAKAGVHVPKVYQTGFIEQTPFLLMQWIEKGVPKHSFWEEFGKKLAVMHQHTALSFGWKTENYIGSLKQVNTECSSWSSFYSECRILPLVYQLQKQGKYSLAQVEATEKLCDKLAERFPVEPPALLHGDLWSGNFMIHSDGSAMIFDPAVYMGHREMDIGMSLLFGGFDETFYHAYHEHYPLEKNWRARVSLTQWYPMLVHALLFGGGYIRQSYEVVKMFS